MRVAVYRKRGGVTAEEGPAGQVPGHTRHTRDARLDLHTQVIQRGPREGGCLDIKTHRISTVQFS